MGAHFRFGILGFLQRLEMLLIFVAMYCPTALPYGLLHVTRYIPLFRRYCSSNLPCRFTCRWRVYITAGLPSSLIYYDHSTHSRIA